MPLVERLLPVHCGEIDPAALEVNIAEMAENRRIVTVEVHGFAQPLLGDVYFKSGRIDLAAVNWQKSLDE